MKSKTKTNATSMFNKLMNNKYVLYFVALIALLDILGYIMRKELSAVLFFYLIGMITYYYNKNMTIVIGSALLATYAMHLVKSMFGIKEGLENADEDEDEDDDEDEDEDEKKMKKVRNLMKKNDKQNKRKKNHDEMPDPDKFAIPDLIPSPDAEDEEEENQNNELAFDTEELANMQNDANKILKGLGSSANRKSTKSGYQNQIKLKPGLYNMPNKKSLEKQLGKADKIEKAYDDLEQVIGENGIKSMSNSTKELVRQQNELLKGLKHVTPALNEAMGAIGKIDLGGLTNLFKSTQSSGGE
jgi:Sec-independent protein translocase protein TatA